MKCLWLHYKCTYRQNWHCVGESSFILAEMRFFLVVLLFPVLICASQWKFGIDGFEELAKFLDAYAEKCQPRKNNLPPDCLEHIKWGLENVIAGPWLTYGPNKYIFSHIPLDKVQKALNSVEMIKQLPSKLEKYGLVAFPSLKEKFTLSALMENCLKGGLDDSSWRPSQDEPWIKTKRLHLYIACKKLPVREVIPVSTKDVCSTLSRCSTKVLSSEKNGCTVDNKCDVTKAFPLMVEMFFYQLAYSVVDSLCPSFCPGEDCKLNNQITSIRKQVKLMNAFVNMIPEKRPFESFYRDAVARKAYSRVNEAMRIISENENAFVDAQFACEEIEAEPACQFLTIRPHYLLLKKMKDLRLQPGHLGNTIDLRLHQNVNHAKMLHLKKDTITHTELLAAVNQLNNNLQVHVNGIASYFKGIAEYEQGIANADKDFIHGKLLDFETNFARLQDKVHTDLKNAMIAMESLLTIELAEESAALVSKIASEANPLKAMFSGVDEKGVRDQAKLVASLAAKLVHGVALIKKLQDVKDDTIEISLLFQENKNQITALIGVVNSILNSGESVRINYDAEGFVEQYAAYTPMVDRNRMAQNIAMWGALKESTCDLLNDVGGILAAAGIAVVNGMLLCENLEGTIAEFNALRENIFDFQFELVDTLARVVGSNIANKLADSIGKQETDLFQAHELLAGFLMSQIFIQSQAWLYCEKIEYLNEGQKVHVCSPQTGLFTNNDLDNLVAFTDHQSYISVDRTVFIPSKPQDSEDLGFINIQKLAKEKKAYFKLPRNITWLYKFGWSLMGETHAPYVENFQLFLPNKNNESATNKVKTSTRIVVSADPDVGCYVSTNVTDAVRYRLPESQTSYLTLYEEGYRSSTCFAEIPSPYSLCNNLPNLCHRSSDKAGGTLLPTILSGWRITYNVQSGNDELEWPAPQPVTNLFFIAKLKLRIRPHVSKRNELPVASLSNDQDVCCRGNQYRSSLVTSVCVECPEESESRMGGYYCEAKLSREKTRREKTRRRN